MLVSKPNYHATKWFPKKTSLIEIRKTEIVKNKLLHLGSSIMMYGFCNKWKNNDDSKGFVAYTKIVIKDIKDDIRKWFLTYKHEVERPKLKVLQHVNIKIVLGMMKDKLGGVSIE